MISADLLSCSLSSQQRGIRYLHLNLISIALFLFLIISRPLFAANHYCDNNIDRSYIGLGHGRLDKAKLDTGTGAVVKTTSNEVNFSWPVASESEHSTALGFDMLYTIMNFDFVTPMTNGHLHTWRLPVTGSYKKNGSEIFYKVTPAISVSSNVLRHPELIDGKALQLNTGLLYKKDIQREYSWVIGFMSDHRFGDYHLYPVAGICWQPTQDWLLQLTLPDFSIRKTFSSGINLVFYVAPEGNQWHVFSKDRQRDSDLTYNAIVTGITAQWSITPTVKLSLEFEKQSRREFSIVLDDNSLIEPQADSSTGLTVRAEVLF